MNNTVSLANLVLKIPLMVWSPYMEACSLDEATLNPTPTCPKPGYNNEILGEILRLLNVSYVVIPLPNETDWGHIDSNGVWQGHLGDVMRGVYDMSAGMYIITQSRVATFSFSYPVAFVKPALFFKKGKAIIDSSSLVKVFNYKVWAAFIGMGILISLASALSVLVMTKKLNQWTFNEVRGQMWLSWTFFTDQSHVDLTDERIRRSSAVCLLLVLLGIESLFFIGNYQGSLLSVLVKEKRLKGITGADDLAVKVAAGEMTLIAPKGLGFIEFIEFSPLPIYQRLRAAFAKNPIQFRDGNEFVIAQEAAKDPTLISVFPTQLNGIQNTQKICGSDYVELWDVPAQYSGFVFRTYPDARTGLFQSKMNEMLAHHNFVQHMYKKYMIANPAEVERCEATNNKMASLDLQSLTALFFLVTIGGVAGMLCIAIEMFKGRRDLRKMQRKIMADVPDWRHPIETIKNHRMSIISENAAYRKKSAAFVKVPKAGALPPMQILAESNENETEGHGGMYRRLGHRRFSDLS